MCYKCEKDRPSGYNFYGRASKIHFINRELSETNDPIDVKGWTCSCGYEALRWEHRHVTDDYFKVTCSKCKAIIPHAFLDDLVGELKEKHV